MPPVAKKTPSALLTAEEFEGSGKYEHYELWDGIPVVREPGGGVSGSIATAVSTRLYMHVVPRGLGGLGDAETPFVVRRRPDRVLCADVAYVSRERLHPWPARGPLPCVPDFVVEVRSPSQTWRRIVEKGAVWISHGAPVVWLLDCVRPRGVILRGYESSIEVGPDDVLDAAPSLPDFKVRLSDLYEGPAAVILRRPDA